jgi:tetratricopeptide (TPR) repeat protein
MDPIVGQSCECGSGLRSQRCCNLQLSALPSAEASRHLLPLVDQAIQEHAEARMEAAERLCLDVLELAPNQTKALSILYDIRAKQGNRRAAETLIRRVVALDPNDIGATNELTLILLKKGNFVEADFHARNAIRTAPENPQAHNLMGMVMTETNRPQSGEHHYRRVLELTGRRDPVLLANLAWNLKNQGRMEEARALYRESIAAAPDIRQTLLGFARLEEADRQFEAACVLLDRMDRLFADDPEVKLSRAVLLGRQRKYDQALAMIDTIAGKEARLGPNELLEKGRLLDQLGRYDDAWEAFAEGKQLARTLSGQVYLDGAASEQISRLRNFFVAGRLRLLPRARVRTDTPQPIFILGFPRSGTTLVEQTLSVHPQIAAGDELPLIHEITEIMPRLLASPLSYPEALVELWMGDRREGLDSLRDYYLQKVQRMGVLHDGATRFTDKMPLNETHLGLIALLFPEAPLIHVLRHPLDVMVSAFSNAFTHGFHCASALETAARHYVRVMDLVQHYRTEMALRYLAVRYEDIVAEQEASVRSMLSFIGEEFDGSCLAFYENRRYARTASYAQVTEPLYVRSVQRWRHYIKHLEPVLPILEPVMERLGYTLGPPVTAGLVRSSQAA